MREEGRRAAGGRKTEGPPQIEFEIER